MKKRTQLYLLCEKIIYTLFFCSVYGLSFLLEMQHYLGFTLSFTFSPRVGSDSQHPIELVICITSSPHPYPIENFFTSDWPVGHCSPLFSCFSPLFMAATAKLGKPESNEWLDYYWNLYQHIGTMTLSIYLSVTECKILHKGRWDQKVIEVLEYIQYRFLSSQYSNAK